MLHDATLVPLDGRLLFLAQSPTAMARQLGGEVLSLAEVGPLRDDVSTDEITPLPILTHYALAKHKPRKLKRLYDQRPAMMEALVREYFAHNK